MKGLEFRVAGVGGVWGVKVFLVCGSVCDVSTEGRVHNDVYSMSARFMRV